MTSKQDLISKIKKLDGISQDERAYLINLVNTKKKYGLVWEDKSEDVEEQLRDNLPVLREVTEKRILTPALSEGEGDSAPNHILIEGDNLHALTALTFTHEGKIDVIYIDPPYNTGNKDFKYNDTFVDKEDSYRHSKWLSFMDKRLRIAKRLLSDKGAIFISIDDNEIAQIKLLCDEVLGNSNFIAELPTIMNLKGNQDQFAFAGTHEYTIVYAKNKLNFKPNSFNFDTDELEEWDEDEIGMFKKGATMRATGTEANREDRPLMFYPIIIDKDNNAFTITKEEHKFIFNNISKSFDDTHLDEIVKKYTNQGYDVVLPNVDSNQYGRWRWGFNDNTISRLLYDVIVIRTKNGISLYKKQRPELGDLPTKKPKSIFYKPEYSSGNGTAQLKNIFQDKRFNNPKPLDLIKDFLVIGSNNNSLILDFFAGSGTTLHATMALNDEDGGNRQCILITNNENNICEEITYERNKRVIQGYTNTKGITVAGLWNNNLRYYKSGFVPSNKSETNKRLLTSASTELLCIKEDCYLDVTATNGFKAAVCKIFTNSRGKFMVVVYHSREQIEVCEQLIPFIQALEIEQPVKLYVFSEEKEALAEMFFDVADKIEAVPLPDAIYNAYRATFRTLKLDKKEPASRETKATSVEEVVELFNEDQD
ncbi:MULTISPECIES: site-specific DNA-methyltransferase [unclassified Flavobacterium]|jgi:adenine-specific DNA-methyltransferase|uniref:site-specific DNA-methyltransferase n=1 Tax=unclassified Flavobacterium TaxID=196869 RepID=UPI0025BE5086|nr:MULTISPECIES: site-specific DNA-methyltransferase [unclassified Flavobacterium]